MVRKAKMIGIIGEDHCGSTILARMMARAPYVASGGELHWLIDVPPNGAEVTRAGWQVTRECVVHGQDCRVVDRAMRTANAESANLYPMALDSWETKVGARYLVSTDKYPRHFIRFIDPGYLLGIVLFKDPWAAVASGMKTNKMTCTEAIETWTSRYEWILDWAPMFCRRFCWVEYADLVMYPKLTMRRIWKALCIDGAAPDGRLATDYCHIGGNPGGHSRAELEADRKAEELDEEALDIVDNHTSAQRLFRDLRVRSLG